MPKTGIRSYQTKTYGRRWLAYYSRDGKQVLRRGFRTSRQAEQWRADAMINASSPADSRITVGEWVTEWLERHRSHIEPSTYRRYSGTLANWTIPHLGYLRLSALTHRHIEALYYTASNRGRSPQTIRQINAPLRKALGEAVRDGLIPHNPATLVRLPPLKQAKINTLTAQEVDAFLKANEEQELYPVYHLTIHTGLRLSELLALQVGRDIDLFAKTVTVNEKRNRDGIGPPKSRASMRRVILPEKAVVILGRATVAKEWGELAFDHKSDYVTRSMPAACKRAGVKRVRFHDLRHTHATHLIGLGANPKAVSARIGHSSVAFTLQVYAHVLPGMDEELADLSSYLFEPKPIKSLSQARSS